MLKRGASCVLRQGSADDLFAVNQLDRSVEDFLAATGDFLLPRRFDVRRRVEGRGDERIGHDISGIALDMHLTLGRVDVHYLCHMPVL